MNSNALRSPGVDRRSKTLPRACYNEAMQAQPTQSAQGGREGIAIASMILGIGAIVLFCVIYVSMPAALLAIILGSLSLRSANRVMAIIGIVCGAISALLSLLWVMAIAALLFGAGKAATSLANEMQKGIATSEIQSEVIAHLGPAATVDGGLDGIHTVSLSDNQWEGTGTATLSAGKKLGFDCIIDLGPQENNNKLHKLVKFTTK